ncbi:hypothetical protein GCM10009618_05380 [Nesterenkonia lacusekhoensis]
MFLLVNLRATAGREGKSRCRGSDGIFGPFGTGLKGGSLSPAEGGPGAVNPEKTPLCVTDGCDQTCVGGWFDE